MPAPGRGGASGLLRSGAPAPNCEVEKRAKRVRADGDSPEALAAAHLLRSAAAQVPPSERRHGDMRRDDYS